MLVEFRAEILENDRPEGRDCRENSVPASVERFKKGDLMFD